MGKSCAIQVTAAGNNNFNYECVNAVACTELIMGSNPNNLSLNLNGQQDVTLTLKVQNAKFVGFLAKADQAPGGLGQNPSWIPGNDLKDLGITPVSYGSDAGQLQFILNIPSGNTVYYGLYVKNTGSTNPYYDDPKIYNPTTTIPPTSDPSIEKRVESTVKHDLSTAKKELDHLI